MGGKKKKQFGRKESRFHGFNSNEWRPYDYFSEWHVKEQYGDDRSVSRPARNEREQCEHLSL